MALINFKPRLEMVLYDSSASTRDWKITVGPVTWLTIRMSCIGQNSVYRASPRLGFDLSGSQACSEASGRYRDQAHRETPERYARQIALLQAAVWPIQGWRDQRSRIAGPEADDPTREPTTSQHEDRHPARLRRTA